MGTAGTQALGVQVNFFVLLVNPATGISSSRNQHIALLLEFFFNQNLYDGVPMCSGCLIILTSWQAVLF